jgi:hypothetical protein
MRLLLSARNDDNAKRVIKNAICQNIKGKMLKMIGNTKKVYTFVSTVPVLLPVRTASGSFFASNFIKTIHLSCLSTMHTREVFSF